MNKKGQKVFYGIMVAIMLFVAATALLEPLKENIRDARTSMDCTATDLSAGETAVCILIDWWMFYFIGAVLSTAMGYIVVKKVTG